MYCSSQEYIKLKSSIIERFTHTTYRERGVAMHSHIWRYFYVALNDVSCLLNLSNNNNKRNSVFKSLNDTCKTCEKGAPQVLRPQKGIKSNRTRDIEMTRDKK